MKTINLAFILIILMFTSSCSEESSLFDSTELSETYLSSESSGGNGQSGGEAGLITAGEWNDIDNWSFWNELLNGQDYSGKPSYWDFYTNNRISILVSSNNVPINNAKVELKKGEDIIWISKTDNFGKAELWVGLFQEENTVNLNEYSLLINDDKITSALKLFDEGVNEFELNSNNSVTNRVELSFIVDATGSMSDELEFLKEDLKDVIQQVENNNSSLKIYTSTVFYRDEEDDYLVKNSGFTQDISTTINFINAQSADGGGDFPEAVHTALHTAITELQWSEEAKTRIAFLLLDAPPHYDQQIVGNIQNSIKEYSEKGIKLIPVTASGIDKETEFLMRFFSVTTNGTYVFITGHSGIGGEHLEASVGEYQVEHLNDLMVRLINKYSK